MAALPLMTCCEVLSCQVTWMAAVDDPLTCCNEVSQSNLWRNYEQSNERVEDRRRADAEQAGTDEDDACLFFVSQDAYQSGSHPEFPLLEGFHWVDS